MSIDNPADMVNNLTGYLHDVPQPCCFGPARGEEVRKRKNKSVHKPVYRIEREIEPKIKNRRFKKIRRIEIREAQGCQEVSCPSGTFAHCLSPDNRIFLRKGRFHAAHIKRRKSGFLHQNQRGIPQGGRGFREDSVRGILCKMNHCPGRRYGGT